MIEQVKVIGIGSPFGPDRIGWEACHYLQNREAPDFLPPGSITYETLDRPGPSLIESLKDTGCAVIIDAMQAGLPAGTVRELSVDDLLQQGQHCSSHSVGVAESLALAGALGDLPAKLIVYGIEAEGAEDSLTPHCLESLAEQFMETLKECLAR